MKIDNYRLNRAIHKDIRTRLLRQKRGYTLDEIKAGAENFDFTQLIQLKQIFPEMYSKIEKELDEGKEKEK